MKRASQIYHLLTRVHGEVINPGWSPRRWPPQSSVSWIIRTGYGAETENKAPELAVVWKGIRCCQSCVFSASWFRVFCPPVAPIVCQMCVSLPILLHVTWDRPGAGFWVISRSHPTPSIAAPFWGEGKWQRRLSRAELPSRVDQRTENRLWIVIRPSLQSPSLPTSSCATKCLLSSSQGVSFNCQLIFLPPVYDNMSHSKMQPRPAQGGRVFLASWTEYSSKRDRMLQPKESLSASHNN